jgi:hypothetical protein
MTSSRRGATAAIVVLALAFATPVAATPENDLDPENLVSDSLPSRATTDHDR